LSFQRLVRPALIRQERRRHRTARHAHQGAPGPAALRARRALDRRWRWRDAPKGGLPSEGSAEVRPGARRRARCCSAIAARLSCRGRPPRRHAPGRGHRRRRRVACSACSATPPMTRVQVARGANPRRGGSPPLDSSRLAGKFPAPAPLAIARGKLASWRSGCAFDAARLPIWRRSGRRRFWEQIDGFRSPTGGGALPWAWPVDHSCRSKLTVPAAR
jgi:hypothetical protein